MYFDMQMHGSHYKPCKCMCVHASVSSNGEDKLLLCFTIIFLLNTLQSKCYHRRVKQPEMI